MLEEIFNFGDLLDKTKVIEFHRQCRPNLISLTNNICAGNKFSLVPNTECNSACEYMHHFLCLIEELKSVK